MDDDTITEPLLLALARKHPRGAQIIEYAEHLRKNEGASTHAAITAATLLATALYGHEGQFAELDAVDHVLGLIAPTPEERVNAIRALSTPSDAAAKAIKFEERWRAFVEEVRSPLLELARNVGSSFDVSRPYDHTHMATFFEKVNGALRGGERSVHFLEEELSKMIELRRQDQERLHFLEDELKKMSEAAQVAEKHAQEWQSRYNRVSLKVEKEDNLRREAAQDLFQNDLDRGIRKPGTDVLDDLEGRRQRRAELVARAEDLLGSVLASLAEVDKQLGVNVPDGRPEEELEERADARRRVLNEVSLNLNPIYVDMPRQLFEVDCILGVRDASYGPLEDLSGRESRRRNRLSEWGRSFRLVKDLAQDVSKLPRSLSNDLSKLQDETIVHEAPVRMQLPERAPCPRCGVKVGDPHLVGCPLRRL